MQNPNWIFVDGTLKAPSAEDKPEGYAA